MHGARRVSLPYDRSCPVVYDNDDHRDTYADEFLLALASAGEIDLRGMITTTPCGIDNPLVPEEDFEAFVAGRAEIVAKARRSGLGNLPDPVAGPCRALRRPPSSRIDDTVPIDTPGSRLIVEEARKADPDAPLVILTGGPLTAVADAYLLDPGIAEHVVVASLLGTRDDMADYNGATDAWAAYIVLERLRYVQFPAGCGPASVPKARLRQLPDTELRQWMIEKHHPTNGLPAEQDADGPPAISLVRPDYVLEVRPIAFSHFLEARGNPTVPVFRAGGTGRATVVTHVSSELATAEFWRVLGNPAAYHARGDR